MSDADEVADEVAYAVAGLWRYPVKSMAGEQVESIDLDAGGVAGDRRWAVRDLETGRLASAKKPRPFGGLLDWAARITDDGSVEVTSPDGDRWMAGDPGLDAALSTAFGGSLAMTPVEAGREETYDSEWPEIPGTALSDVEMELPVAMMTERSSFVDLAAVHLVVADSVDHLAGLIGADVPVERFRPTMLLRATDTSAAPGFADLSWVDRTATVGGVGLAISGPAPRCVMTTLPQGGHGRQREVLATLAEHARHDTGMGVFACLGTYGEVATPGSVRLGDRFTLDA